MPTDNLASRYIGHGVFVHGASLHAAALSHCLEAARDAQRGATIIPLKTKAD